MKKKQMSMKLIQLGGSNDGISYFLSFGGFDILLDCGIFLDSFVHDAAGKPTSDHGPLRVMVPSFQAIDVKSLDVILISNHYSMLALPLLTDCFGFRGKIYATQSTIDFGCVLLEDLAGESARIKFELASFQENSSIFGPVASSGKEFVCFTKAHIKQCCNRIIRAEFKENIQVGPNLNIVSGSSGFSLGSCFWVLESYGEKFAYAPAASADLNRHPKELDFTALIDCDALLITDLKPDRDPLSTTERMVEGFLTSLTRVLNRNGTCVIPSSCSGVLFDLIETVYAYLHAHKCQVPIFLLSSNAEEIMNLTEVGAEWLSQKKIEKLYAGESAFLHAGLVRNKLLHLRSKLTSALVATFRSGGRIIFVDHPSLRTGLSPELIQNLGHSSKNALILVDPSFNPTETVAPYYHLEIEKIHCPIDPRLSCGDANQLIARCSPKVLLVPEEYSFQQNTADTNETSHLSHVLPLESLVPPKSKTKLSTFRVKHGQVVAIEKSCKYVDARIDSQLASTISMSPLDGKAAALVSGVSGVRKGSLFVQQDGLFKARDVEIQRKTLNLTTKHKILSPSSVYHLPTGIVSSFSAPRVGFLERTSILLGNIDEEELMQEIKAQNPQADVYISGTDAEVLLNIPALDARITLWKEERRSKIEVPSEETRKLLTACLSSQLKCISP